MTYLEILSEAYQKGLIAMNECVPTPVGFCSADLVGNQTSPVEIVEEGECGGAYLSGISGRSRFVTWFKKNAEPQTSSHRWEIGKFSLSKGSVGSIVQPFFTNNF